MEKKTEKDNYMKRWIVILLTAMAVMLTVDLCAQDRQRGVEISGGTDLVSGYVWRGVWEAGVSLQPTLALAAGNFSVTAWGSVDFATTSYKEMDLTMAYALGPVKAAPVTGAQSVVTISVSVPTPRTVSRLG